MFHPTVMVETNAAELRPRSKQSGLVLPQWRRRDEGVTKDYAEAGKCFRKAAEQNVALAQYDLGLAYANGKGVAKDEVEGYKWFWLAAEQGDEPAKKNVAVAQSRLTPEQIAEGQRLARNFKPQEAAGD